jgi:membrane protein CcdC involved in cytochrome C biogenesis
MPKSFKKRASYLTPILILVPIVMFWRGVWGLLDVIFFPDDKLISYGLCVFIGFSILLITEVRFNSNGETIYIQSKKSPVKVRLG